MNNLQNINVDKSLYEEFHKSTSSATKIPDITDFGMINHLPLYSKYIKKGDWILDIGCGAAPMSLYAANKGAVVKGVELSERAISENRKAAEYLNLTNLSFECEDFMAYCDDSVYDIIMLTEVLEHLPDDKFSLKKICQLMKPGGYLLMSVPSVNAPLHKRYVRKFGKDPFDERVGHLRRYNAVTVFNLVYMAGFELVEFKLCEGYLRNWLYNDEIGQLFMKFNRKFIKKIVTFVDDKFFTPIWGESDIIIAARKR